MEPNACPRCGDFAELAPYGRVAWCEACRRAAAFDLTPVESLRGWRGIRQTLALVRRLRLLRLSPWLYTGLATLGAMALYRFTNLPAGVAHLFATALQGFVNLWASTWLCRCLLAELETGRYDARAAFRASLPALPMLLVMTLLASAPPILHQLLSDSDQPAASPGNFLRVVISLGCAFVPALAAQGERSSLVAVYRSVLLVRAAGSTLLVAMLLYGLAFGVFYMLMNLLVLELVISYALSSFDYFMWARRVKLSEQLATWLPALLHPYQVAYLLLASLKLRGAIGR